MKVQDSLGLKQMTTETELDRIQRMKEKVRKTNKKGWFSDVAKMTCANCTFEHRMDESCPTEGKACRYCGLEGPLTNSSIC